MTQFRGLLNDTELSAVLTYVRNAFGNKASAVQESDVQKAREATAQKGGFWSPTDLERLHPED
ncbi:MAG: hypothetical protein HOI66_11945 [Verrucomicrobia bacterium]|nr:hypothetical protein [Verrucomicrobiota bacterium]